MSFKADSLARIKRNREKKLAGGYNSIPFGLTRFQHFIPGVQHSNYVIVTAGPGVGKTKVTKNLFVFRPFDFVREHPGLNIKFTTLYFCLEEPGPSFIDSVISHQLWKQHKLRVSVKELRSQLDPDDPTAVVSSDLLEKIEDMDSYIDEFEKSVILIDDIRKPYAIYKKCQEYLESVGDWSMKPSKVYNPKTKTTETMMVKDKYQTEHPDHYVQIIIDHLSLLEPEKGQDLFEAMRMFSSTYAVQLRNRYHCSLVIVQQQTADKAKQQYTYKGASIESKLEPSSDGLGNCKETFRDCDEMIGVFAPDQFEIADHRGYDITKLKDNYRSLSVLKSRDGEPNLRLGVVFDGCTNYIAELPEESKMTSADYHKVYRTVGRAPTT